MAYDVPKYKYKPYSGTKPHKGQSKEETDFYRSLSIMLPKGTKMIRNDRSLLDGKELDVLIPSLKIAFEFNGVYYHSTKVQFDKYYHINKSVECEERGVKLIQIFSDEWESNRSLVIDHIRKELEIWCPNLKWDASLRHIQSRSLRVVELPVDEGRNFFSFYDLHGCLQGVSRYVGLKRENTLYMACAIREDDNRFEIVQLTSQRGVWVDGGLEKLMKYLKGKKEVDVLLDRRLYTGKSFENIGFKLREYTSPNQYITRDFKTKINLTENGDELLPTLTDEELEVMHYYRVYDSGCMRLRLA